MVKRIIKRVLPVVVGVMLISTLLSACGKSFECDFCNQKSKDNMYNLTGFGLGYVCEECYDFLW